MMVVTPGLRWHLSLALLMGILAKPALAAPAVGSPTAPPPRQAMSPCGRAYRFTGHRRMAGNEWDMLEGMLRPIMMMGGYAQLGLLQLSDEQRSKIEAIRHQHRQRELTLVEKIMDEMDKIRDLMSASRRDPSTIGKAYEPVFILQRRMIESSVAAMNKVEAVLNKAQRAKLRAQRHRGMGYGLMGF